GPAGARVHEDGVEAGGAGAEDVDGVEVADVGRLARLETGAVERDLEDARIGLLDADLGGVDDEVQVAAETKLAQDVGDGAVGVGDHRGGQSRAPGQHEG